MSGKLCVGSAGKPMLEALPHEESPAFRAMLLSGTGAARVRDGFDELVLGFTDRNWIVRHGGAWGLGELGDPRSLPARSEAASTEEDSLVLKVILAAKASLSESLAEEIGGWPGRGRAPPPRIGSPGAGTPDSGDTARNGASAHR